MAKAVAFCSCNCLIKSGFCLGQSMEMIVLSPKAFFALAINPAWLVPLELGSGSGSGADFFTIAFSASDFCFGFDCGFDCGFVSGWLGKVSGAGFGAGFEFAFSATRSGPALLRPPVGGSTVPGALSKSRVGRECCCGVPSDCSVRGSDSSR